MEFELITLNNVEMLVCSATSGKLDSEEAALQLIGQAFNSGAGVIVVPVEMLDDDFFQLKSGLAGQILQKFINYRFRLVILGNISPYLSQSRALRDFVYEANRGNQIWFLESLPELARRLGNDAQSENNEQTVPGLS